MILYKANPEQSRIHNILGFDYIIESNTHYIQLSVITDIVHSIYIEEKPHMNKPSIEEYEITLSECYEVVAFAKDIRAVVGQKIYIIESEVYPYSGNHVKL
tara:strand:+ start:414 stop:716 length:303 start_codon:yes stop_codon:yes gene_type:complete